MTRSKPLSKRLSELRPGESGTVLTVGGESRFRLRLQEMGVVAGNRIDVLAAAPFGGPMKLRVPHYLLAMRRAEAQQVTVSVSE
jgi:Fe2+ transport system protein FeoA